MNHRARLQQVQQALDEALRKRERVAAEVERRRGPPRVGDLFVFREPSAIGVQWAVVRTRPGDSTLLFAVPADTNPLAGTADLEIPDAAACGPLTLRCAHGLWIPVIDLARETRSGYLEDKYVRRGRDLVARLGTGERAGTPEQQEVDADPEYREWLELVEEARATLAAWLNEPGLLHFPEDFGKPSEPVAAEEMPLAAAPRGLMGDVFEVLRQAAFKKPQLCPVECDYPGTLYLVAEDDNLRLLWYGSEKAPPAVRVIGKGGRARPVRWVANAGRTAFRSARPLAWSGGQVVLAVGPGAGTRVTVRR